MISKRVASIELCKPFPKSMLILKNNKELKFISRLMLSGNLK